MRQGSCRIVDGVDDAALTVEVIEVGYRRMAIATDDSRRTADRGPAVRPTLVVARMADRPALDVGREKRSVPIFQSVRPTI